MTPIPDPDISQNGACWHQLPVLGEVPALQPPVLCELKAGHRGAHEQRHEHGVARWTNEAEQITDSWDELFGITPERRREMNEAVGKAFDEAWRRDLATRETAAERFSFPLYHHGPKPPAATEKLIQEAVNEAARSRAEAGEFRVAAPSPLEGAEDEPSMIEKVREVGEKLAARERDREKAVAELRRMGVVMDPWTTGWFATRVPVGYFLMAEEPSRLWSSLANEEAAHRRNLWQAAREAIARDIAAVTKTPPIHIPQDHDPRSTPMTEPEMKTHKIFDTTDDNRDYVQLRRAPHDPSLLNLRARDTDHDAAVFLDPTKVREALDDLFPEKHDDHVHWGFASHPVELYDAGGEVPAGIDLANDTEEAESILGSDTWLKSMEIEFTTTNPETIRILTGQSDRDAKIDAQLLRDDFGDGALEAATSMIRNLREQLRRERVAHGERKSEAIQLREKYEAAKKMNAGLQVGIRRAKEARRDAEVDRDYARGLLQAVRIPPTPSEREAALRRGVVVAQQERDAARESERELQKGLGDAVDQIVELRRQLMEAETSLASMEPDLRTARTLLAEAKRDRNIARRQREEARGQRDEAHLDLVRTRNRLASAERDRNSARQQRDAAVDAKQRYGTALDEARTTIERLEHDLALTPGVGAKQGGPRFATDVSIDGRRLLVDGRELPWHVQDGPTLELLAPSNGDDPQMLALRIGILVEGPVKIA